jgi:hypothetical protein
MEEFPHRPGWTEQSQILSILLNFSFFSLFGIHPPGYLFRRVNTFCEPRVPGPDARLLHKYTALRIFIQFIRHFAQKNFS